ncbi:hypothetical protein F4774DRAFT_392735 [Daldinia eschscholtzii]|nr:hypothetical protein F4774DRAFT_392735 [Daldinia eschscholtzii]
MFNQAEILFGKMNRECCNTQGSYGQLILADTSMTPATDEKRQATIDTSIQNTPQRDLDPVSMIPSSDGSKPHFEQANDSNNHATRRDDDSGRPVHDTHACSDQQFPNGSGRASLTVINDDIKDRREAVDMPALASTYINLHRYLAQQQIVSNYKLEVWLAETLRNGPLRVMPQLKNPDDWLPREGTDNSHHNWESDLETMRSETLHEI